MYFYPQPFLESFDGIYLDAYEQGGFVLLESGGFGREFTDFRMTMDLADNEVIPGTNHSQSVQS